MSLNSDQLDAFYAIAQCQSFSRAADELAVTQSALSQRIKKLEESLRATVFVRNTNGLTLTDTGQRLLLYCRNRRDLESEFIDSSSPSSKGLRGPIRIAGFSSVMRSLVIPALSDTVAQHPKVQFDLLTRELYELPLLLKSSQTDFILTQHPLPNAGFESHRLASEEYVLVEATRAAVDTADVYLDHDAEDQTTFDFLKRQHRKRPLVLRRSFLDEVYAIMDAVEEGWGRAVLPRHLIHGRRRLRVNESHAPMKSDIYLCYQTQPFYLPLHQLVLAELSAKIPAHLAKLT